MSPDKVIIALDLPSASEALKLVDLLGDRCTFYKVGLELYTTAGPNILTQLKRRDKKVFLDLKLHDIPNTVARATARAAGLGATFLTIHATGGHQMISAAAQVAPKCLTLLAVTVLTSLDQSSLAAILGRPVESTSAEVVRLATIAKEAGAGGIVCSATEAANVKKVMGPTSPIVTPGIRLPGSESQDQRRVSTPSRAFHAGATHIVVGRPVTQASSPVAALNELLGE